MLLCHPDPEVFFCGAYIKVGFFKIRIALLYHDTIYRSLSKKVDKKIDLLLTKYRERRAEKGKDAAGILNLKKARFVN
ncbi:hypothetical protein A4D02_13765 [Niastella koreensis]|uniref:Uncharacterized protein n=1 Tax=Niastella koreensis TaxID=354356 RepID=A0ABX3NQQ9_9BACT|nr:hypothetical protein A4D02_13765 [Niastella koreensis]